MEFEGRLKERNDGSYEAFSQLSDSERQAVLISESEAYRHADTEARSWGIGGSKSRAVNAGTILLTGILGGQSDLQTAANTLSPYTAAAIGNTLGHGVNQNETAQLLGHFLLGATLAYINGGDPLSGGSAAVAAEKAAQYLSQQYNDGQTAIDPQTGEFNPNLLPEQIKEEIKATTGVIAAIVGATGDNGSALNAQIGGVLGQNAVENNWLHSQTAKQKGWLSQTEIALLDKLATQSGARSIEYFIQEEQKIRQSNMSGADKEKALANLKREYEADSRKMEAAAAKLPKGSKERGQLFTIASKMQGIVSVLPPYEKSEFVRAEQRDWLPTANPIIHSGDSGFVAVQRQWAINDGKTPEEARFQTEMTAGGRGGEFKRVCCGR